MLRFELLQLMEVAGDRLPVGVRRAVDANVGAERLVHVGELVFRAVTGVRVVLPRRVWVG